MDTNKPGTDKPYFTKAEVDAMLANMVVVQMDFGILTPLNKLDSIIRQIATKFGFTVNRLQQ
jgi:hypothetical protein